jgi:uncharacterized protein (TIGR02996 family)
VNEDEAFIRAIVDSPGDDLPRLVYADWLDDRDDPRGAYLRAEAEWAKPWRGGECPADSPALRELTSGLDPVWVARVSRPPVGACCEQIAFTGRGPRVTQDDLDSFERANRLRLPNDYRAFLLNLNGGFTPVAWLPTPRNEAGIELTCLYALCPFAGEAPADGPQRLQGIEGFGDGVWPYLPIGDCGGREWMIVMDVTRDVFDVLLFEDYTEDCLIPLTESFAQFLSILEPHGHEER